MGLIGKNNIDRAKSVIQIVALLAFGDDEDLCQRLKFTVALDKNRYKWYIMNTKDFMTLRLTHSMTKGFVFNNENESELRNYIESMTNDSLENISKDVKTLKQEYC